MRTEIIAAALIVASAIIGVRVIDGAPERAPSPAQAALAQPMPHGAASAQRHWGREVRISAAHDHQFYVDADINRRRAKFLVDTGASYVALRDSDAREAGIYTAWTDYTYPVRTANGETKAAYVTLDVIEINGIRVENVKAFILPDDQLAVNLLGMSFLSRIESVEARAGELVLRG
ncbi:MAG: peptidase [Hyphococcus sp.]|nr:MAG: peptidase [Marinicaulis sp.]